MCSISKFIVERESHGYENVSDIFSPCVCSLRLQVVRYFAAQTFVAKLRAGKVPDPTLEQDLLVALPKVWRSLGCEIGKGGRQLATLIVGVEVTLLYVVRIVKGI